MPMGGEILIQLNILDNNQLSIRFIDRGCGIPKERIPYLGEPFIVLKKRDWLRVNDAVIKSLKHIRERYLLRVK